MNSNTQISTGFTVMEKAKAYFQLLKFRLSFIVTFSGSMAYILASKSEIDYGRLIAFALGGFLVTGSANIINQLLEVKYDRLMKRTENRPLPTQVLSPIEAIVFCVLIGIAGLLIHFQINGLEQGLNCCHLEEEEI